MTTLPIITVYGFGEGFGLPEMSPFVMKTEIQFKMAGLPYIKDLTGFANAPKGKLPYIDDGEVVPDSTFIRLHIERKYDVDLDAGLDARERAAAWAIERLLEDHLTWATTYFDWFHGDNFAKGPAHFFDDAPEEMRAKLRQDTRDRVAADLRAHGVGRHSTEEILLLGQWSLSTASTLLGDRRYLMGDRVTSVDATAVGILAGVLTPFFDSPLRRAAEGFPNLTDYVGRMMQEFFPDFAWRSEERTAERAKVAA